MSSSSIESFRGVLHATERGKTIFQLEAVSKFVDRCNTGSSAQVRCSLKVVRL